MTLLMQGKKKEKKKKKKRRNRYPHHSYATNHLNTSMASVALTESFVCDRLEEDSVDESVILNNTFLENKDTKTESTTAKDTKETKEDAKIFNSNPRFHLPSRTLNAFKNRRPVHQHSNINGYRSNNNRNHY